MVAHSAAGHIAASSTASSRVAQGSLAAPDLQALAFGIVAQRRIRAQYASRFEFIGVIQHALVDRLALFLGALGALAAGFGDKQHVSHLSFSDGSYWLHLVIPGQRPARFIFVIPERAAGPNPESV